MSARSRRITGQPSLSRSVSIIACMLLASGLLTVPDASFREARAESVWTTDTFDDFNGTGAEFDNCTVRGEGANASIVLNNTPY
ncbi:MAG: hypothetical protein FJ149_02905 [Euryarchaeota archaeon]|nr:hypothetical protein [Euryarchaeota archaeon]